MSTAPANAYAVILAGGSGTRFWPKSRQKHPKQLCKIGDQGMTMIEKTLHRIDGYIPPDRRIIVTHKDQLAKTKEIVGDACRYMIAEPEARNTAAALALAALEIQALHKGASAPVMVSLHADHIIENEPAFRDDLSRAIAVAEKGYLTLLGVKPTGPATGFGYIERGPALSNAAEAFRVASFREKPNLETATAYVARGNFYWNAGYFVWRVDTLIGELKEHLAVTIDNLAAYQAREKKLFSEGDPSKLAEVYKTLPKVAIDNAILEVSKNVAVIATHFGWHDVGSWDALDDCTPADANGNHLSGDVLTIGCKNITVDADSAFVACIGLDDIVVVQTKDAILVCPKSRAQEVKAVVEALAEKKRTALL